MHLILHSLTKDCGISLQLSNGHIFLGGQQSIYDFQKRFVFFLKQISTNLYYYVHFIIYFFYFISSQK